MEPFQYRKSEHENQPLLLELRSWIEAYPGLTAGFTTRNGGVSRECFTSLNCALHVHDHEEDVIRNRKLVAQACGLPFEAWTCGEQVHGSQVYVVRAEERGRGKESRLDAIPQTDALVTNVTELMLTSFYADCVPILFVDPVQQVIGLAHAGWRGTVSNIGAATVHNMQAHYGCHLKHIQVAIGPSISLCCYQVDGFILQEIKRVLAQYPEMLNRQDAILRPTLDGHAGLELRELNRQLLIQAGILTTNIECTKICTGCNLDLFYSHRMEGGKTGRMVSWIAWKKEG